MVCTIKKIDINGQGKRWKWLWLMYVKGVDLNYHCQQCLLGTKSRKMRDVLRNGWGENIRLTETQDTKYYYLCGGSLPYKWENNFHLAWKEVEGEILEVDEQGITVTIENAVRVDFSKDDINYSLKNASNKWFNTCRNWQFANKVSDELSKTDVEIDNLQTKLM